MTCRSSPCKTMRSLFRNRKKMQRKMRKKPPRNLLPSTAPRRIMRAFPWRSRLTTKKSFVVCCSIFLCLYFIFAAIVIQKVPFGIVSHRNIFPTDEPTISGTWRFKVPSPFRCRSISLTNRFIEHNTNPMATSQFLNDANKGHTPPTTTWLDLASHTHSNTLDRVRPHVQIRLFLCRHYLPILQCKSWWKGQSSFGTLLRFSEGFLFSRVLFKGEGRICILLFSFPISQSPLSRIVGFIR
mmetsp:Transcript_33200/g.76540  ORF Transcript_33200/g.76540 Transcript_33200/m.76540 type:complete len:240 (+) Transcript_33200:3444-4163(+)